jgi:hypothetical protein
MNYKEILKQLETIQFHIAEEVKKDTDFLHTLHAVDLAIDELNCLQANNLIK